MTMRLCKTCEFWDADEEARKEGYGYCRAEPPHIDKGWPTTSELDWCGSWEAKDDDDLPAGEPDDYGEANAEYSESDELEGVSGPDHEPAKDGGQHDADKRN